MTTPDNKTTVHADAATPAAPRTALEIARDLDVTRAAIKGGMARLEDLLEEWRICNGGKPRRKGKAAA